MKTLGFYTPPQTFSPAEWERLRQVLKREEQVDVRVVVDLPAIGAEGYDEDVAAMQKTFLTELTDYFGQRIVVERRSGSGGIMASRTYRIRLLETED